MILVLGGTGEARAIAAALDAEGVAVTTSLAGRVSQPRLPPGAVRIGGFGGPDALAAWLQAHEVRAVIDATHPFAERISTSAAAACAAAQVPRLRLQRPGWTARPGDRFTWVDDLDAAARELRDERVFLTSGRQGLSAFAGVPAAWFLIRCVEPPDPPLPPQHELILDRGPYTVPGELALIDRHRIEVLVTKDSGGTMTEAKLDAARLRSLPVIVIRRPPPVTGEAVATVADAVDWARTHAG